MPADGPAVIRWWYATWPRTPICSTIPIARNTSRASSSTSIGTWWRRVTAPSIATDPGFSSRRLMRLRGEIGLVVLAALVFGAVFSYPLVLHLGVLSSFWDWDFLMQLALATHTSIVKYHQLPLWNPWKCGGVPLLGDPGARVLNPFFPLTLLFGPAIGVHLEVPLHLAIAWAGGYVLGRIQGMRRLGAVACASAFASSSWFPLHVAAGDVVMMGFCYFPWLLAFGWLA